MIIIKLLFYKDHVNFFNNKNYHCQTIMKTVNLSSKMQYNKELKNNSFFVIKSYKYNYFFVIAFSEGPLWRNI